MPKQVIVGGRISIAGAIPRHEIVKIVICHFIDTEAGQTGKGYRFKYPVEDLPNGQTLFIERPGMKWNFDFKVGVTPDMGLGKGRHENIKRDWERKKRENPQVFPYLVQATREIYDCQENDVNLVLERYPQLRNAFKVGADVEVLLKVVKWMFIMEDIIYWNYEGRAKLFSYLID